MILLPSLSDAAFHISPCCAAIADASIRHFTLPRDGIAILLRRSLTLTMLPPLFSHAISLTPPPPPLYAAERRRVCCAACHISPSRFRQLFLRHAIDAIIFDISATPIISFRFLADYFLMVSSRCHYFVFAFAAFRYLRRFQRHYADAISAFAARLPFSTAP